MKGFISKLSLYGFVLMASLLMPFFTVGASELKPSVRLSSSNGVAEVVATVSDYSKTFESGFEYLTFTNTSTGFGAVISVDSRGYKNLSESEKQDLMSFTLETIQGSSLVKTDLNKVYNFICNQDTSVSLLVRKLSSDSSGSLYDAYVLIKPFTGYIGTGLALLSIGLFIGLVTSFILDLFFITNPIFSALVVRDDTKKPKFVSREAWDVYLSDNDVKNKKKGDVLIWYIFKKWKQTVIVSISILYLSSGQIWGIVADIVGLVRGFFG